LFFGYTVTIYKGEFTDYKAEVNTYIKIVCGSLFLFILSLAQELLPPRRLIVLYVYNAINGFGEYSNISEFGENNPIGKMPRG